MADKRKKLEASFPADMDKECIVLCAAMSAVPGIKTHESCCGHGKHRYLVFFRADNLHALPPLLYWFDGCHTGFHEWSVRVSTDCGMSPVCFVAEGPVGQQGYDESEKIAELLWNHLEPDGIHALEVTE